MTDSNTSAPVLTCAACAERGKTWNGSDPVCAFANGAFSEDNWSCATVERLREVVCEGQNPMPPHVDYRFCFDQKYATVQIDHVEDAQGERIGLALWVSWYKNRGRTEAMWVLDADKPPRAPTESELLAILAHFEP